MSSSVDGDAHEKSRMVGSSRMAGKNGGTDRQGWSLATDG